MDYQIAANTRRCSVSGRELLPGERFFSVLLDENGKLVRRDYATECWRGPPEGAFSFWSGRVPSQENRSRPPIDDELLVDCLHRLEGQADPGRQNFRYVVALLLMRRKRLRFEEARVEEGQEILWLRCTRTGECLHVVNPSLSEAEIAAVQDEVFQLLGWD